MVKNTESRDQSMRNKSLQKFVLSIIVLILAGYLLTIKNFRIDLTADKRYTLSDVTRNMLTDLNEYVYIRVYLDGELPVQFTRLKKSISDILEEYRVIARKNLDYEFINPHEAESKEVKNELFTYLYNIGLKPVNIMDTDEDGGSVERLVFPGVVISCNGVEIGVNLLKNNPALSADMNLNNSIQSLEYEFTNMINNLVMKDLQKVAFIEGHGELNDLETGDITRELANYYQVDRGRMNGIPGALDDYAAVIIAKPSQEFTEEDKFVLDQYVMNGGKIAWFIDLIQADMDSMINGSTVAIAKQLNLDDILFTYGIRINYELIKDIQSNVIPVNTALTGEKARFVPAPWLYYPLLEGNDDHPVSANINYVLGTFVNPLEPVGDNGLQQKTVLLSSSKASKTVQVPALITLEEIRQTPQKSEFNRSHIPVAYLIEGEFNSVFKNRPVTAYQKSGDAPFKEKSVTNKMLIVGDGDMIKNDLTIKGGQPMISPVGYDKYTRQTFGNRDFILNAINYLTDDKGIITLRGREFKLRLLDKTKIKEQRVMWQLINLLLPLLSIALFGIIYHFIRVRKYAKK